jgi:sulfur carrier protein ThiS
MSKVTVFLGTILQKKTPQGNQRKLEVTLEEGKTILDLIQQLEIEIDPDYLLLALNGRAAKLDQVIKDKDKIHLMLPISGG